MSIERRNLFLKTEKGRVWKLKLNMKRYKEQKKDLFDKLTSVKHEKEEAGWRVMYKDTLVHFIEFYSQS